jgi:hypothetical protein
LGRGGPPFLDGLGGSPVGRRGRVHVGSGVQVLSRCQVPSEERGGGVCARGGEGAVSSLLVAWKPYSEDDEDDTVLHL